MTMEKRVRQRISGHTYKALFKLRAKKPKIPDNTREVRGTEAGLSRKFHIPEKQRVNFNFQKIHLRKAGINNEDNVGVEAELHSRLTGKKSQLDTGSVSQHQKCAICMKNGTLLCCKGQGCRRSFHLSCVSPPLTYFPPGAWHCNWCNERKMKFGIYSVSEGIESICDAREPMINKEDKKKQKKYLVKYKGLSHVHNRWITETQLISEAPESSTRLKKNLQITQNNRDWSVPHRLLDKRLIILPGHDSSGSDCHYEWLVKWKGLSYKETTWESEKASFMMTPEVMKLKSSFESCQKNCNRGSHVPDADERRKHSFTELSELPLQGSAHILNCNLAYVNKLREYWHRGEGALIIDERERVLKVVLFILSFQGDLKQPFLIVTPSNVLSLWESEFSHWASGENIVVYKGNSTIRATIKTLEFYNEAGCIMFQVLLSPVEVVIEDLEMLERIKWEAVVIDECQRPSISDNLKHIKMLSADMRLLLLSCDIQDKRFNYQAALSLLDLEFDEHAPDNDPNYEFCNLKERLTKFVAFECKSCTSKIAEYWVPVRLSNVQIEQYCDSLLSNTVMLCSNSKIDSVDDSLHKLLTLTRKCCDHPYLVDHSVQNFLTSGLPEADNLDVGISLSGKLQLLNKILIATKEHSLRVLIIYQSLGGSGPISSIGDILADFVHQSLGQNSYTRIDREIIRSRKCPRFNIFNQEDSGKLVCLIEKRACRSSIKCSSVDVVILFDSDWNPTNDIRALQKIRIDSQLQPLKVLRLFSSFTVEEQILILAKQGVTLESNTESINRRTCHTLLNWGAHYLFDKLDLMHGYRAPDSHLNERPEESFLEDVLLELSAILPNKSEAIDPTSCSIISCVQQTEGAYTSNTLLLGELELQSMENFLVIKQFMDNEPHDFWTNLLEGREHQWKYLPKPAARKRKTIQYPVCVPDRLDSEVNPIESKRKKVVNRKANITPLGVRFSNKRKVSVPVKGSCVAGVSEPCGNNFKCLPYSTNSEHFPNYVSDHLYLSHMPDDVFMACNKGDEVTLGAKFTQVEQHNEAATPYNGETASYPRLPTVQLHVGPSQRAPSFLPQAPNPPNPPTQVQRQPGVGEFTGPSGSSVLQLVPNSRPQQFIEHSMVEIQSDELYFRSTNITSEPGINHPLHKSFDPLQLELEIIKKNKEEAIKAHKDTKLRLKSDYDREIAEIQKRYESLVKEAEMTLLQKRKDLETRFRIVYSNELLAKALKKKNESMVQLASVGLLKEATVSSFLDIIAQFTQSRTIMATPGIQQSMASLCQPVNQSEQMMNQMPVVYPAPDGIVPGMDRSLVNLPMADQPTVTSTVIPSSELRQTTLPTTQQIQQSSANLLMTTNLVTQPLQSVVRPTSILQTSRFMPQFNESLSGRRTVYPPATMAMQSVVHGSALSADPPRLLDIPTIRCQSNLYVGKALRAPAPHLQYKRSSSHVATSNFPHLSNALPVIHSSTDPRPTSGHPTLPSMGLSELPSGP